MPIEHMTIKKHRKEINMITFPFRKGAIYEISLPQIQANTLVVNNLGITNYRYLTKT